MLLTRPTALSLLPIFGLLISQSLAQTTAVKEAPSAVEPAPRDGNWMKRHESINEKAKQGDIDLVFIGDSITQGWEKNGKDVWDKYYQPRKALNAGIGGDRTQHVLWRLDNGNVDGLKPKLAVIMIGTNNSNKDGNTGEQIADGIKAVVERVRSKLPETKILLLAVFPRKDRFEGHMDKIKRTNELAARFGDDKMVHFLDINSKLVQPDGTISEDVMYDYLHLTPKGYGIWAEAIEPKVAELMK